MIHRFIDIKLLRLHSLYLRPARIILCTAGFLICPYSDIIFLLCFELCYLLRCRLAAAHCHSLLAGSELAVCCVHYLIAAGLGSLFLPFGGEAFLRSCQFRQACGSGIYREVQCLCSFEVSGAFDNDLVFADRLTIPSIRYGIICTEPVSCGNRLDKATIINITYLLWRFSNEIQKNVQNHRDPHSGSSYP